MWIAKNRLTGKTYGHEWNNIYDCQNYIDKELKILNYLYEQAEDIEARLEEKINFNPNPILCYNTEQNRFATSFDF